MRHTEYIIKGHMLHDLLKGDYIYWNQLIDPDHSKLIPTGYPVYRRRPDFASLVYPNIFLYREYDSSNNDSDKEKEGGYWRIGTIKNNELEGDVIYPNESYYDVIF